ncbi:MAG: hypothetical protein K2X66_04500 [Cyanobacteria bacterium]|nr:hypothetical protein [Cyanobacteriota bacterium]
MKSSLLCLDLPKALTRILKGIYLEDGNSLTRLYQASKKWAWQHSSLQRVPYQKLVLHQELPLGARPLFVSQNKFQIAEASQPLATDFLATCVGLVWHYPLDARTPGYSGMHGLAHLDARMSYAKLKAFLNEIHAQEAVIGIKVGYAEGVSHSLGALEKCFMELGLMFSQEGLLPKPIYWLEDSRYYSGVASFNQQVYRYSHGN